MKTVILQHAQRVRDTLLERVRQKTANVKGYYMGYSSDSLEGWCYEASCILRKALMQDGIEPLLIEGRVEDTHGRLHFHYWLEYHGHIIDVTGDQFNKYMEGETIPAVLYAPMTNCPRYRKSGVSPPPYQVNFGWVENIVM